MWKIKKFILPWYTLFCIMICGLFLTAIETICYQESSNKPVTCVFEKWDAGSTLQMKLKCGKESYWSKDSKLILHHIQNPSSEIKGILYNSGEVKSEKNQH
jgi:hypothetical protein